MKRIVRSIASPSMAVSIIALIVALGGAGYSATGGSFILGRSNTATTSSRLTADIDGRTLALRNANAGSQATPLALFAAAGRPPFTVNSTTKVAKLNADGLDGLDSTNFPRSVVIPFNLAPGATSAPIALPPGQQAFVMAATTSSLQAVGWAVLQATPTALFWTGSGGTMNFNGQGQRIFYISMSNLVQVETGGNDNQSIRVHNTASNTSFAGTVTLIW